MMITRLPTFLLTAALTFAACDQASCEAVHSAAKPTLEAVLARADASKLQKCAELPTQKDAARCLGAEALTLGLELALEHATALLEEARQAGHPQAGAADMTDAEKAALAADLAHALDELAREVDATNKA